MLVHQKENEGRFNIGLIGCGSVVEGLHLPALQRIPGATVKWVCDSSPGRAREVARNWGIKQFFTQLSECSDVDAVLVATPVGSRRSILAQTAERGWHALCEKPFGANTKEHHEMIDLAARNGLILGAGYMRRHFWSVERARHLLRSNVFGPLVEIVASEAASLDRTGLDQSSYRNNAQASGGGVLMETGCHLLDELMYTSDADSVDIENCDQKLWDGYEVETVASGSIALHSGPRVGLHCTVSGVEPVFQGIAFRCDSGEIRLKLDPGKGLDLFVGKDQPHQLVIPHPNPSLNHVSDAFRCEWIHFLDGIRQPGNWDVYQETGLLTTDAIMQCRDLVTSTSSMVKL